MSEARAFDAIVVGAGIHGLSTAWHLSRLGVDRVALVERFRFGHDRGSSHGSARITRSTYADELDVRLMQVAHAEEWPRLERDAGTRLVHRCDGAFFGPPGGTLERYADAVSSVGADVERLSPAEARGRFPAFRFTDTPFVLHDRTGGLLAAADTVHALARLASIAGVFSLEQTRVLAIEPGAGHVSVATDRGMLTAERVVVTAGAWIATLVPALGARLAVQRQNVGYFRLAGPAEHMALGHFPVWACLGGGPDDLFYGLPAFGGEGIKAAAHRVSGPPDDPDEQPSADPAAIERVRQFLARQLAVPVDGIVRAETCLYTNTLDERFLLGPLPGHANVVVGSACSGHGFKFGPLVGRLLAELVLDGRTTVEDFERSRARFAIGAPD